MQKLNKHENPLQQHRTRSTRNTKHDYKSEGAGSDISERCCKPVMQSSKNSTQNTIQH